MGTQRTAQRYRPDTVLLAHRWNSVRCLMHNKREASASAAGLRLYKSKRAKKDSLAWIYMQNVYFIAEAANISALCSTSFFCCSETAGV